MTQDQNDQTDDHISKSARKRDATKLQALGKRLAELNTQQLADLVLPDRLYRSILDYQRFPSREARRRQLQFIGKLMRDVEIDVITEQLDALAGQSNTAQYQQSRSEMWRERLLSDPAALPDYINEHPHVDRQKLRQLVRKTQGAKTDDQRKIEARALFRFLHDIERQA